MYQHDSQIDRDDGLKEEGLEVVGHMGDDNEEDGWDVHRQDCPEEPSEMIEFMLEQRISY